MRTRGHGRGWRALAAVFAAFGPLAVTVALAAWPASGAAHEERVILALDEDQCTRRLEADDRWRTLRLRVLPETSACRFSQASVQALLAAVGELGPPTDPEQAYTSLFLGRLVDYPWPSSQLATTAARDPGWDAVRGRPVGRSINSYVGAQLSRPEVLAFFEAPLAAGGYRVTAVTVEKVLVGRCGDLPQVGTAAQCAGTVPFDAMVWLVLGRRSAGVDDTVRRY